MFRPAVDAYSRALFVLCMRITRDAMLAEDAVQEEFFNAYRSLDKFDGHSSFKTWLHRIAAIAVLEQLRRHGTHVLAAPMSGDDGDDFLDRQLDETPRPDPTSTSKVTKLADDRLGHPLIDALPV